MDFSKIDIDPDFPVIAGLPAGPIERLIEQGDVVYGVWLDKTKPCGIDFEVLKGIGERCRAGFVRKTVVPCGSREQAIIIRTMFCSP